MDGRMEMEMWRQRLEADPLDAEAATRLREALASPAAPSPPAAERTVKPPPGVGVPTPPRPLAPSDMLAEILGVLDGGDGWRRGDDVPPAKLGPAVYELLATHPREKQERQHQFGSLAGRALHLLQGNDTARAIARVTERATPERFPHLCRRAAACAAALSVTLPALHIARGEEPLFLLLLDRWPFVCVHTAFLEEGSFTAAELTFALGRFFRQIRGGHAALSQVGPERLESLLLDELPFLVRTPLRMATRAVGRTGAGEAVKSLGERLPASKARQVVSAVGSILPRRDQETVLPETLHDWVRRFLEGVEWSADRAGLLLCGSPGAACGALLGLSPALAPRLPELREQGARRLLQNPERIGRGPADRLRELLRFALSREYLAFAAPGQERM